MPPDTVKKDGRSNRGRQTQERLIQAALRLFAEKGYAGVGIREVAAGAETNIASISFHFINKDGLYKAVIEHVAGALARMHQQAIETARQSGEPDEAGEAQLVRIVENLIATSLTSQRSQWMSLLLQREFIDPTDYFTIIYDRALQPLLELFLELLGNTPAADPEISATLRNQALSFLLFIITSAFMRNKNTFLHLAGKKDYDPDSIRQIARITADFASNGLFSKPK